MPLAKKRIGLLGGSFNPAHEGHIHLSLHALKACHLDEVWWLVSPHNPLKEKSSLAVYDRRIEHARILTARHKNIIISDYEERYQLFYSYDTIRSLLVHYPATEFVWLMGADNLACFHRWRDWDRLFFTLPIAVFDRAPFSHAALRSKAASRFCSYRTAPQTLTHIALPAWSYIHMPRHGAQATELRKTLGDSGFLRHNESVTNQ